jgi:uncharacterized membrane protein YqjE
MAQEPVGPGEPQTPRGWKERLAAAWDAAASLVSTRVQIFQEELSQKTGFVARGSLAIILGLAFGWLALLLFTALVAALLTLLFGHLWAGLLAAFVLYLAVAGGAVWMGVKAFSRVRPFDFPATSDELKKDWSALRRSASPDERVIPQPYRAPAPVPPIENLEERFRAGSAEGGE